MRRRLDPGVRDGVLELGLGRVVALVLEALVEIGADDRHVPGQPDTQPARAPARQAPDDNVVFVQVGAFGNRENADRRVALLKRAGIYNSMLQEDRSGDAVLYRVRIGPIREVIQYDILVEELENIGIMDPYLVTD